MVSLSEIHYSRDDCISAVRDYYSFLKKMYLDEDNVLEPPEGGWPNITAQNLQGCDKTDEVVALLRRLPYISDASGRVVAHGSANCFFTDWQNRASDDPNAIAYNITSKWITEDFEENVPSHVVGLTDGPDNHELFFLLDTKLGIIHWLHCPHEWRHYQVRERIDGDPASYGRRNEAEWRGDAPAWAIADFFEVLKERFRSLDFVPISNRKVIFADSRNYTGSQDVVPMVQEIYRAHGWPNLDEYRKHDCMLAIRAAMEARYPSVGLEP